MKNLVRRFARTPSFTLMTVLTLAIGIGANVAIFSVLNGVLLRPLPYPDPDQLVGVWQTSALQGLPEVQASPATYFTYREEGRTFEDIGLWRNDSVTVTGLAEPENLDALWVTDGTLPILGVAPARGRWFTKQDDSAGAAKTAMLSWGYWQRRFGGDASAVGKRIIVDGEAREIIGVMPPGFRFMNSHFSLILPFQMDRNKVFIGNFSYFAVARLKSGMTIAQANADVARMIPIMLHKFPPIAGVSLEIFEQAKFGPSVRLLKQDVIGDAGKALWVLMATVGMVLLIACANVANLVLVRAEGRQLEFAIRAALGAGRRRLARDMLSESMAVGVMGGAVGIGLAYGFVRLLVFLAPANLPRLDEISIDGRVLLFALGISILSGLMFGLIPVYKYARTQQNIGLRDGGRTASHGRERHRARNMLVVAQVAMALVLLVSSGLMIRTLQAMRHVEPGFTAPEQIQTLRISIPSAQVPVNDRVIRMHEDIIRRLSAIPGVKSVAATNSITMDGNNGNDPIFAEDRPQDNAKVPPLRRYKYVTPGVFATMGNPLIAGRDVTWTDVEEGRPVVLLSENLARELWGDPRAAIGKRVREIPTGKWREVIGVAGNERDDGVDHKAPTIVYWPIRVHDLWQFPDQVQNTLAYAVRTQRAGSASLLNDIRKAVWSVNPDLPLADVRTVREIYDRSMSRTSFVLVMLSMAAGMALLLGLVGLYGVVSYSVSQRTREIGIRIALGAQHGAVRAMFVRHGLVLTAIGLVLGGALAVAVTRIMQTLLFGVSPTDPATYALVAVLLIAASMAATYIPARRATVVDPAEALRTE